MIADAGTPGVGDPGSRLVHAVLDTGHRVTTIPGPAAFVAALVISGLDTTRFVFDGFLPQIGWPAHCPSRRPGRRGGARTVVLSEAPRAPQGGTNGDGSGPSLRPSPPGGARAQLAKLHETMWRGAMADATARL